MSFILWKILIGKPKNKVERSKGIGKNNFSFVLKMSENIKFKVKKLKKYQQKFRKKAKAGSQNKNQIQVKICQEYISGKDASPEFAAKIFG